MNQIILHDAAEYSKLIRQYCRNSHPEKRQGSLQISRNFSDSSKVDIYIKPCTLDLVGDIIIYNFVHIMANVHIITHEHIHTGHEVQLSHVGNPEFIRYYDKTIHPDVWIYGGAYILPKCTSIAKGCIIGVGSIVTKPITEEYTIWAGNPARKIGSR
jgi:acetyltransferase-like isoleucine patch superfamily enzyme